MGRFVPLSIPNFEGNERKYVDDALDQGWVSTGGAYITELEEKLAEFLHVEKTAAVQSGTSALHLSLIACGVQPGDMVIVPTLTFIAAVNPVRYQFAEPVFMDCDDSLCMDPQKLHRFCENECVTEDGQLKHKATGKTVKAIVVVHVFGNMADMEAIMDIAQEFHLKVIEDAYNKMAKIKDTDSSYDQVYVKVDDLKNVGDVEEAIHDLGFQNTWSSNQQREDMQKQVFRSQMIFGGVAAVSLLVAAINIINTMTMAIYERTREIGVMKVLGCEINNIRTMFLMESSCIGFIGGVLGVLISLLVSFILNNLTTIMASFGQYIDLSGIMGGYGASSSTISIIPPWLMLGALVFATLIGLVSGILPANKAVKISALEAIRHD